MVRLHRQIFRRNQARINDSVYGYTPTFRRYEREYMQAVSSYQRRVDVPALDHALRSAEVVYVGDYHTLPQAQKTFLRLLKRLPAERPVVVALEFVRGRHQKTVDAFMADQISESAFLRGIQHESHWVFGGWESFRPVFELAKERSHLVLGIDSMGRGGAGASLHERDRYAARRIARTARDHPDHIIMVLIGELHTAPAHLPQAVDERLGKLDLTRKRLIVYQNCEEVYWRLQRRGLEHDTEVVRVAKDQYCLMNTPPIVCQQSFLNWLDIDEEGPQLEAPEQNFKEYTRIIANFFDLEIGEGVDEVELATVVDLSFLQRLQRRGDFSAQDMRQIKRQVLRSESYYIPRAKMVYLGNLSVNHASEEATHFLRHVCSGSIEPRLLVDAFYARIIEEAIGFLGSKLINHKRKCAHLQHFERLARSRSAGPEEKRLARLVLRHTRLESGKRVRGMAEVYECEVDLFNALTHVLGYRLGDKLYYGLVQGEITKVEIRELFLDSLEEDGAALTTYLYLLSRTATVRIPERM